MTILLFLALVPLVQASTLLERGQDYEIWQNGDGTRSFIAGAPLWVFDSANNNYTKWIYSETGSQYNLQNGKVGLVVWKSSGRATVKDSSMISTRVPEERWTVEKLSGGVWTDTNIHTTTPTFSSINNSTGLYLTIKFSNAEGKLNVTYILKEGKLLKHDVKFTNDGSLGEFRVLQKWFDMTGASRIVYANGDKDISSAGSTYLFQNNTTWIRFEDSSGKLFVFEDLSGSLQEFKEANLTHNGTAVNTTYVYSNSTLFNLSTGATLMIDPQTFTNSDPIVDGSVSTTNAQSSTCPSTASGVSNSSTTMRSYHEDASIAIPSGGNCERSFVEWNLSALPSGTVNNTVLKLRYVEAALHSSGDEPVGQPDCEIRNMTNRPSESSAQQVLDGENGATFSTFDCTLECISCTAQTNVDITVDLGASADTEVQNRIGGVNWFAIGLRLAGNSRNDCAPNCPFSTTWGTEEAGTPPTLNITYSIIATTINASILSFTKADLHPNQTFNQTFFLTGRDEGTNNVTNTNCTLVQTQGNLNPFASFNNTNFNVTPGGKVGIDFGLTNVTEGNYSGSMRCSGLNEGVLRNATITYVVNSTNFTTTLVGLPASFTKSALDTETATQNFNLTAGPGTNPVTGIICSTNATTGGGTPISPFTTFNNSNFNMNPSQVVHLKATFTEVTQGTYSGFINCEGLNEGQTRKASIQYVFTSNPVPPVGGGGGGGGGGAAAVLPFSPGFEAVWAIVQPNFFIPAEPGGETIQKLIIRNNGDVTITSIDLKCAPSIGEDVNGCDFLFFKDRQFGKLDFVSSPVFIPPGQTQELEFIVRVPSDIQVSPVFGKSVLFSITGRIGGVERVATVNVLIHKIVGAIGAGVTGLAFGATGGIPNWALSLFGLTALFLIVRQFL